MLCWRLQLDAYLNSCTQYEVNLYFKVTFQYNYQGFNISEKFSLFDKILCMFLLAMRHSEFKNKGNRMPLMNNLDDYTPWADSMETISWLDRIAC